MIDKTRLDKLGICYFMLCNNLAEEKKNDKLYSCQC